MEKYASLTADLARRFPKWLGPIADVADLDGDLLNILSSCVNNTSRFTYDVYRYENLLSDVTTLLDKCLAYRREFNDLAASAVRQAMEYSLFKAQKDFLEQLEIAPWTKDIRQLDAAGQTSTAAAFGTATHPLSVGFQESAKANSAVSAKAVDAECSRQGLVRSRWKAFIAYQEGLEGRHETPGHPLNYAQRAVRVRKYLLADFEEAILKGLSAARGLEIVHGISHPLDFAGVDSALDNFTFWVRALITELERKTDKDIETTFVFGLSAPKVGVINILGNSGGGDPMSWAPQTYMRPRAVSAYLRFKNLNSVPRPELVSAKLDIHPPERSSFTLFNVSILPSTSTIYPNANIYNVPLNRKPDHIMSDWTAIITSMVYHDDNIVMTTLMDMISWVFIKFVCVGQLRTPPPIGSAPKP
jgi:hypothetical protein